MKGSSQGPGEARARWRPHVTKGVAWLVTSVLTAAIGVVVPLVLAGVLNGDDEGGRPPATAPPAQMQPRVLVPESKLVTAQRVGPYVVEDGGSAQDAADALGQPSSTKRRGGDCTIIWDAQGLIMEFGTSGTADPCLYGSFCTAQVSGRDWSTAEGLQPGMRIRRMTELYPRARKVEEAGEIVRYVLDPGLALCGRDAEGGLEAWTNAGRVFALRVSFEAGG